MKYRFDFFLDENVMWPLSFKFSSDWFLLFVYTFTISLVLLHCFSEKVSYAIYVFCNLSFPLWPNK